MSRRSRKSKKFKKNLVRKVINRLVGKVKRKIGNKKFYKKGLRTKPLNNAISQRGGFSL